MKFEYHLKNHKTPEWREKYIDYHALKELIDFQKSEKYDEEVADLQAIEFQTNLFVEAFKKRMIKEADKIENFYLDRMKNNKKIMDTLFEKLREYKMAKLNRQSEKAKFDFLKFQKRKEKARLQKEKEAERQIKFEKTFAKYQQTSEFENKNINLADQPHHHEHHYGLKDLAHDINVFAHHQLDHIKHSHFFEDHFKNFGFHHKSHSEKFEKLISEFYMSLQLLRHYQEINATGCRKIIKKYNKNFQTKVKDAEIYSKRNFADLKRVNKMIENVENVAADFYGDKTVAMNKIRVSEWMFNEEAGIQPNVLILSGILYWRGFLELWAYLLW